MRFEALLGRAAAEEILRMLGLNEERYSSFTSSCRSGTITSWATR
jgi:hypothetical protein